MIQPEANAPFNKSDLSYANTFDDPLRVRLIRTMEWCSGKVTLLRHIREFERSAPPSGQAFWQEALKRMRVTLATPPEYMARIPKDGPLIVVANHPHGLVDGMILAEMIGRVRQDYKILARYLLTRVAEVKDFLIPVPFPHDSDARAQNLAMRAQAMEQLRAGGVVILFPSGGVAQAETPFGNAVEGPWHPFTAKLIKQSNADVLPVRFTGQNSRAYQIAANVSTTLRQGLLLHEVVNSFGKTITPHVGEAISAKKLTESSATPREMLERLRIHTVNLTPS